MTNGKDIKTPTERKEQAIKDRLAKQEREDMEKTMELWKKQYKWLGR
jgi:hypothetical protein